MSRIKEYLTQLSTLRFFEKQLESYKPVEIQSYTEHPEVKKIVEQFLKGFKPRPKGCYNNSTQLTLFDSRFNYELGHAFYLIPIEHAWNSYDGFHFDLTAEIALKSTFEEYGLIKTLDQPLLLDLIGDNLLPPTLVEVYNQDL